MTADKYVFKPKYVHSQRRADRQRKVNERNQRYLENSS